MATYSRVILSGSTNGKPIPVAATSSPGTTIHTAITGTGGSDEIYLWVSNIDSASHSLTLQWGGTTDAEMLTKTCSIPANSPPIPIAPGISLQNSLIVKAFADTTNVLNISGQVNRIS